MGCKIMKTQNIQKVVENIKKRSPARAEAYLLYKLKNDEIEGFKVTLNTLSDKEETK